MATEEIRIRLTAEGNAKVEIDKVEKELTQLQKSTKALGKTFKNVFETAAGVAIGQGLVGAFNLAGKGLREFTNLLGDGVRAAQVQEDSIQKLNTALAQSGQFSIETSESLQEFASALQRTTKFGDETILNAQALLQSLGRLDEEGLKQATVAALDMSAALGIDLNAAVTLVGKAAAGEISSFTRYGVVIEKGATKTETFANTLEALNTNFGGAAAAQILTFSGAVQQAQNTFGDFTESLGFILTENASIKAAIGTFNDVFVDLQKAIEDNRKEIDEFVSAVIVSVVNVIPTAIDAFNDLLDTFNSIGNVITTLRIELNRPIFATDEQRAAFKEFEKEQLEAFDKLNVAAKERSNALIRLRDITKDLGKEVINATGGQEKSFDALRKQSDAAKKAAASVRELTAAQEASAASGVTLAKSLGVGGVASPAEQQKAQQAEIQALREADLLSQEDFFSRQAEIKLTAFEAEQAQIQSAADAELLTREQASAAILANQQKLAGDLNKISAARTDLEAKQAKQRTADQRSSLNEISTLQSSGNKTLFRVGQAAALATATIDGIASVQKTAAAFPFPFNIPFTAAAAAASAANIAKIVGTRPPGLQGGIDEVPPGFNNDGFAALLSSGERVVPAQTNQDLTAFLAGQQNTDALLGQLIGAVRESGNVMVQVGDEEVTASVRRGLESGGTIAVEA